MWRHTYAFHTVGARHVGKDWPISSPQADRPVTYANFIIMTWSRCDDIEAERTPDQITCGLRKLCRGDTETIHAMLPKLLAQTAGRDLHDCPKLTRRAHRSPK